MNAPPKQNRRVVNDAEIAWVEWGNPGDPLLLLSHATGFHARCWDQTAKLLDGYHVIATDHRGHGQSSNTPPFGWEQFGTDLSSFTAALDLGEITGVGHSMGGHCMVQAAARELDRFRKLMLFDPVIFAPSVYESRPVTGEVEHPVARRRNDWDSPQQMFDAFKNRAPYSRWHPEVLRDYCDHGLTRVQDRYQLACPPAVEAGIYRSAMDMNIYDYVPLVKVPVTVVRAEERGFRAAAQDFSLSPTWPKLAGEFVRGEDRYHPEHSHFMPMESPALAAAIISAS